MNMAPSVATLPIDASFAHGDVISKPSSSVHATSVALTHKKIRQPVGNMNTRKGGGGKGKRTRWGSD